MSVIEITPPADFPVTVQECADFMRVTHRKDDSRIEGFIAAATAMAQDYLCTQFLTATWEQDWMGFQDPLILRRVPLLAVSSIKYLPSDGSAQTEWNAGSYVVDTASRPGRAWLGYGLTFPTTLVRTGAVVARFTCGHGTDALDVPEPMRQAVMALVNQLYYGSPADDPMTDGIRAMLDRIGSFGECG